MEKKLFLASNIFGGDTFFGEGNDDVTVAAAVVAEIISKYREKLRF